MNDLHNIVFLNLFLAPLVGLSFLYKKIQLPQVNATILGINLLILIYLLNLGFFSITNTTLIPLSLHFVGDGFAIYLAIIINILLFTKLSNQSLVVLGFAQLLIFSSDLWQIYFWFSAICLLIFGSLPKPQAIKLAKVYMIANIIIFLCLTFITLASLQTNLINITMSSYQAPIANLMLIYKIFILSLLLISIVFLQIDDIQNNIIYVVLNVIFIYLLFRFSGTIFAVSFEEMKSFLQQIALYGLLFAVVSYFFLRKNLNIYFLIILLNLILFLAIGSGNSIQNLFIGLMGFIVLSVILLLSKQYSFGILPILSAIYFSIGLEIKFSQTLQFDFYLYYIFASLFISNICIVLYFYEKIKSDFSSKKLIISLFILVIYIFLVSKDFYLQKTILNFTQSLESYQKYLSPTPVNTEATNEQNQP